MKDTLAYMCGGPSDGSCVTTQELLSSFAIPIQEYKWSEDTKISNRNADTRARVYHFTGEHECSWTSWENRVGMEGPQLVEQMWAELDAGYHKMNNDNTMTSEKVENLKGYLRGIAWCLTLFMQPHFKTADEIVQETHKRYVQRLAGNEEYTTPGTGLRRGDLPEGATSKYTRTNTVPLTPPKHNFTDEQVTKIRAARSNGFPPEELATMYGVKVDVIKSL